MQVKDLKDAIKDLPDDMEVILQKDGEGNGYSPLSEADSDCIYIAESTWSGEVMRTQWSAADADMEEDDWQEMLKNPRCLVLYPVN